MMTLKATNSGLGESERVKTLMTPGVFPMERSMKNVVQTLTCGDRGRENLNGPLSVCEAGLGMTVVLVMRPQQHNISIPSPKKLWKGAPTNSTRRLHSLAAALPNDHLQIFMSALINLYCPLTIDMSQVFRVSVRMKDSYH